MAFKPIDPKRDEFRRYLERNGVIESLTKVFVRIVKERPENPLEYLRSHLGDTLQEEDNLAYLRSEFNDARSEVQRLRSIIQNVSPHTLEEYDKEMQQQQQQQQQEQAQLSMAALSLKDEDAGNVDSANTAAAVVTAKKDENDVASTTAVVEEKANITNSETSEVVEQLNDVEGQKENNVEKATLSEGHLINENAPSNVVVTPNISGESNVK